MGKLLWVIIVALIAFWLLGFVMKIGGGLIHLLLVIAGIIFVVQLLTGRRSCISEKGCHVRHPFILCYLIESSWRYIHVFRNCLPSADKESIFNIPSSS